MTSRPADRRRRSARSGAAPTAPAARAPSASRRARHHGREPGRQRLRLARRHADAQAGCVRCRIGASTTRRRPSRPMRTSGVSGGGAASPDFLLKRSVGQVGRKSDTTLGIACLHFKSALSPARHRISSSRQRARPTPWNGQWGDGRTDTRQRLTLGVGWPKSVASVCRRQRRMAMPMAPELRRRAAAAARPSSKAGLVSATTAPSPPCRRPSSKQASTDFSSPAST
jgi:hypothetical protein